MKNLPLLLATVLGTIVLIVAAAVFLSPTQNNANQSKEIDQVSLLAGANHVRGPENAPITIVEFSDLQCPACRSAAPLAKAVLEKYPDQVRLVYRHFPLVTIHKYAQVAALTSEVAAEQNKFWEFHDLVFENQAEWSSLGSQNEVITTFSTYFDQLGIDKTDLKQRIESSDIEQRVNKESALAQNLGVTATPTFFVNGRQTSAPQLLSTVESLLTAAQ